MAQREETMQSQSVAAARAFYQNLETLITPAEGQSLSDRLEQTVHGNIRPEIVMMRRIEDAVKNDGVTWKEIVPNAQTEDAAKNAVQDRFKKVCETYANYIFKNAGPGKKVSKMLHTVSLRMEDAGKELSALDPTGSKSSEDIKNIIEDVARSGIAAGLYDITGQVPTKEYVEKVDAQLFKAKKENGGVGPDALLTIHLKNMRDKNK